MKKNLTLIFSTVSVIFSLLAIGINIYTHSLLKETKENQERIEAEQTRQEYSAFQKVADYRYGRNPSVFRYQKEKVNRPANWVPGNRISSTTKKGMECRRFNGRQYCRERARKYKRSTTPACKCECNCVPKCNSI